MYKDASIVWVQEGTCKNVNELIHVFMFMCVLMYVHVNAQTYDCMDVQMYKCTSARTYRCLAVPMYAHID